MTLIFPIRQEDYVMLGEELFLTMPLILHGYNHQEQQRLLHENLALMTNLNNSLALDILCLDGEAYDGTGKIIDSSILKTLYRERHKAKGLLRGENIGASFKFIEKRKERIMHIGQHSLESEMNVIELYSPLDSDTLRVYREIDLSDYVRKNHTNQGLPRKKVREGSFLYYPPEDGKVTRLGAESSKTYLYCKWDSEILVDWVGTRAEIHTRNLKQFIEEQRDKNRQ